MKWLRHIMLGIIILCTSSFVFSQYSYCMVNYSIKMNNGGIVNGYVSENCKYVEDTVFQVGSDIFKSMQDKRKFDTIEIYSSHFHYYHDFINEVGDSDIIDRNFYLNKKAIALKDVKSITYLGQIREYMLVDCIDVITEKDTLLLNKPILDFFCINICDYDSFYVSGLYYKFYVHSNSVKNKKFMSDLKSFNEKYFGNIKDSNSYNPIVGMSKNRYDAMLVEFYTLIKRMNGLDILLLTAEYD